MEMKNQDIIQICNDVFNDWWKRWRDASAPAAVDQAAGEGIDLIRRYSTDDEINLLVLHMVDDLVNVLSDRVDPPDKVRAARERRKRILIKKLQEVIE